ncbi:MAG: hydrogenase iron-sulfur subunit [Myxococcota bacterium]|jgi:coenzyme F420-reducing hydrogenase delta subunit/NAD-dependent dihydropyrimidine dehydrogenase PreA subunit|nr:hydrogenase iron-sulfur subunit [Myxococcota bacterium]
MAGRDIESEQFQGSGPPGSPQPVSVIGDLRAASQLPDEPKGALRALEKGFLYLDRLIERAVPDTLNPLQHTGAIAVVTFLVAAVTGIVVLIWYRPSVNLAYESVEAMSSSPLTAGLVRSLHRYSSDACVFFGTIHAIRFFLERRFGGARWLAWVTGMLMVGILWFIGWTGYWLVWDVRAQMVAMGTAKVIDVLPIFVDPLERSFLTDEGVNSLLFFVVFFFHMLVPLAMGVVMWLHITRLSRPRFLTNKPMTWWVMGTLLLLCVAYPATSSAPAAMAALPRDLTIDWFYLLPLALTDRMSGGAVWGLALFGGIFLFSIPWWLAGKRPEPASVAGSRCNECRKCYTDCPYGAIEMVARTEGNMKYATQALVLPSKCVSCGVCAGSCDTAGIGLDAFSSIEQRRRVESWLAEAKAEDENTNIAFTCAESAGAGLTVDPETGRCKELPDFRVLQIPCIGWVHPLMIERAVRHGAGGVLLAACGPGECLYREGSQWMRERLEGEREPRLRTEKIEGHELRFVELDRTRTADLIREARSMSGGGETGLRDTAPSSPAMAVAAAVFLAVISAGATGAVSDLSYIAPYVEGSELVVSFKHPGAVAEKCRELSEEEIAARPVHMRKATDCERKRSTVRLRVGVDGNEILRKDFPPTGLWGDGSSVAVERIPLPTGQHAVSIEIGDTGDPDEWSFNESRSLEFTSDAKRVVIFDRVSGFSWH